MSGVCFVQRLQKEPLHRRQKSQDIWKTIWMYYVMTYCFPNLFMNLQFGAFEAISCLECHGTGTALGDPIEAGPSCHPTALLSIPFAVVATWKVGAQKAVYGKSQSSFALAAGKTNLGHLEGRKRWNLWNTAVPWNIMKGHMKHHETFCWVGKWTLSILSTNTAKSLWLFAPGAAGVAGLSKAAWSSSCSSPSPDPTQCCQIGCDCHRSCRVNEHKCQHCYGSASAALKIWIKQKTELAHWQIKYWNILTTSLNKFMWTVNLNFHYSNIFTDSPWITWFLCLWGWTTTLIWLDFLLPFPQRSLIGGRMQEERLCPLSASVEPTDMPRPQSFPAKSWISVNFPLFFSLSLSLSSSCQ